MTIRRLRVMDMNAAELRRVIEDIDLNFRLLETMFQAISAPNGGGVPWMTEDGETVVDGNGNTIVTGWATALERILLMRPHTADQWVESPGNPVVERTGNPVWT